MKRILILGAANDQYPLIKEAKDLGYYIVCCDRTTTNPGLPFVDKHYQVDYMDKERVLEIARKENVDGVISNSECVMQNVAYVSEQLGLRGNSVMAVRSLGEKDKFRKLQKKCGVYAPAQVDVSNADEAVDAIRRMKLPVIIKPCQNSASRGLAKIEEFDEDYIRCQFEKSSESSWNGKVSIEEFVTMPSLDVIEGDIFVYDNRIMYDGLFHNRRSPLAPMIPMNDYSPLILSEDDMNKVKSTILKLIDGAGIIFGQFNVEMYFNTNHELFVIEVNTRQGGVGVPAYLFQFTGINFSRLLVSLAVDDYSYEKKLEEVKFPNYKHVISYQVFSRSEGVYNGVYIDEEIRPFVNRVKNFVQLGDKIGISRSGAEAVANVNLVFPEYEQERYYAQDIEKYIYSLVK